MKEVTSCLICGSALTKVMDVGVVLMKCNICSFVQNKFQEQKDYSQYRERTDKEHSDKLLAIVQKAQNAIELKDGDKVLDIGCGDGSLLGWYVKGVTTIGVEPSVPLIKEALQSHRADVAICDLFSVSNLNYHFANMGLSAPKFKIVTAVDVLQLVDQPKLFMSDCKKLLHDEGVLIVQVPYLGATITSRQLEKIQQDVSSYFTVHPLQLLAKEAGLELQGMELQSTGTVRGYITHPNFNDFLAQDYAKRSWLYSNLQLKIIEEIHAGFYEPFIYQAFEQSLSKTQASRQTA